MEPAEGIPWILQKGMPFHIFSLGTFGILTGQFAKILLLSVLALDLEGVHDVKLQSVMLVWS